MGNKNRPQPAPLPHRRPSSTPLAYSDSTDETVSAMASNGILEASDSHGSLASLVAAAAADAATAQPSSVSNARPELLTYDSLQDLLERAGYKETRIVTPLAHRIQSAQQQQQQQQQQAAVDDGDVRVPTVAPASIQTSSGEQQGDVRPRLTKRRSWLASVWASAASAFGDQRDVVAAKEPTSQKRATWGARSVHPRRDDLVTPPPPQVDTRVSQRRSVRGAVDLTSDEAHVHVVNPVPIDPLPRTPSRPDKNGAPEEPSHDAQLHEARRKTKRDQQNHHARAPSSSALWTASLRFRRSANALLVGSVAAASTATASSSSSSSSSPFVNAGGRVVPNRRSQPLLTTISTTTTATDAAEASTTGERRGPEAEAMLPHGRKKSRPTLVDAFGGNGADRSLDDGMAPDAPTPVELRRRVRENRERQEWSDSVSSLRAFRQGQAVAVGGAAPALARRSERALAPVPTSTDVVQPRQLVAEAISKLNPMGDGSPSTKRHHPGNAEGQEREPGTDSSDVIPELFSMPASPVISHGDAVALRNESCLVPLGSGMRRMRSVEALQLASHELGLLGGVSAATRAAAAESTTATLPRRASRSTFLSWRGLMGGVGADSIREEPPSSRPASSGGTVAVPRIVVHEEPPQSFSAAREDSNESLVEALQGVTTTTTFLADETDASGAAGVGVGDDVGDASGSRRHGTTGAATPHPASPARARQHDVEGQAGADGGGPSSAAPAPAPTPAPAPPMLVLTSPTANSTPKPIDLASNEFEPRSFSPLAPLRIAARGSRTAQAVRQRIPKKKRNDGGASSSSSAAAAAAAAATAAARRGVTKKSAAAAARSANVATDGSPSRDGAAAAKRAGGDVAVAPGQRPSRKAERTASPTSQRGRGAGAAGAAAAADSPPATTTRQRAGRDVGEAMRNAGKLSGRSSIEALRREVAARKLSHPESCDAVDAGAFHGDVLHAESSREHGRIGGAAGSAGTRPSLVSSSIPRSVEESEDDPFSSFVRAAEHAKRQAAGVDVQQQQQQQQQQQRRRQGGESRPSPSTETRGTSQRPKSLGPRNAASEAKRNKRASRGESANPLRDVTAPKGHATTADTTGAKRQTTTSSGTPLDIATPASMLAGRHEMASTAGAGSSEERRGTEESSGGQVPAAAAAQAAAQAALRQGRSRSVTPLGCATSAVLNTATTFDGVAKEGRAEAKEGVVDEGADKGGGKTVAASSPVRHALPQKPSQRVLAHMASSASISSSTSTGSSTSSGHKPTRRGKRGGGKAAAAAAAAAAAGAAMTAAAARRTVGGEEDVD